MTVNAKRAIIRFSIFAAFGLTAEVLATAGGQHYAGDPDFWVWYNLHGHSSPWMLPVYGLLAFLVPPLSRPFIQRGVPLPVRAFVYMLAIFAIEYVVGVVYTLCGLTVWNYNYVLPYALCGPFGQHAHIMLPSVVPWYLLGLGAEYLYDRVDLCALALAKGVSREAVEGM